jgi:hypothetical protein
MRLRFAPILSILLAMLFPQPSKLAPVSPDADAPDRLQTAVREATCAEASPATFSDKLKGTSLSNILTGASAARAVFYVSSDGKDTWSGHLPKANSRRTDGPFASIERARDAARQKGGQNTIAMGNGDYYLAEPIVFDARDAGLIIAARCNEAPVLHGGPIVRNWTAQADGRWKASLKLPAGRDVGDLFVSGALQTQARFPNAPLDGDPRKGWLFAAKCTQDDDLWHGNTRFCFHAGDLPISKNAAGLVAHIVGGFHPGSQWGSDTLPVVSIDTANRAINTQGTGYFFTAEGSRYFLTGAAALLDAPGEWWYDRAAGQLAYIPTDRLPTGSTAVAGILPTFTLAGRKAPKNDQEWRVKRRERLA